ncbi:MAG: SHOCT domain-containing protein [Parcubacteria group bacterium]|nr:SHOCT domain-containing protein [Parcubacteria group bacterium]
MTDTKQKEFKGYNGTLIVTDTGVIIKRGVKGFLLGGGMLRGDKTIPYSSIVAVQLKKAGLVAGYLQLTLKGGSEAKSGLFQSTTDENTVNFHSGKNKIFAEVKTLLEEKINFANSNHPQHSELDELEKLATLKEKGIITEEEFNAKKKSILNL